jgi:hypothetical protein
MQRSSARGYVEPVVVLVAVFVVGVGLTLYASALAARDEADGRQVAEVVLKSVAGEAESLGVIRPGALRRAAAPAGWSVNLTVVSPAGRWSTGGTPPPSADRARRRVAVRLGPGVLRPGVLEVAVW